MSRSLDGLGDQRGGRRLVSTALLCAPPRIHNPERVGWRLPPQQGAFVTRRPLLQSTVSQRGASGRERVKSWFCDMAGCSRDERRASADLDRFQILCQPCLVLGRFKSARLNSTSKGLPEWLALFTGIPQLRVAGLFTLSGT